ncbi:MAG: squalene/phytoene synthase family protein [Alphaproteobacteria bacterium]|nr:squalene/phytoene synthase family protein [Alphaproteobacteria bacterium]MBL6953889.1 squalene/phytoene synthase family protein [Alphaproteobacteria bacterium]
MADGGVADGELENGAGALAYCLTELRREDRDRYLTLLFAPRPARPALAALYAFNLECARAVSAGGQQPLLGQMRLQWWRDGLTAGPAGVEGAEGGAENHAHPVLTALAGPKDRGQGLAPDLLAPLHGLLAARERDLTALPFATLADVVAQAEATGGALAALAARKLDADLAARSLAAARAAGTAYALAGMLRAIPYQQPGRGYQGRLCLPQDLLAAHGLTAAEVWSGTKAGAVAACVAQVAAAASQQLAPLANLGPTGPALSPLLHGSLARAYLRRLARACYDPFAPDLGLHPLGRPLLLCWRALLRRP